MDKWKGYDLLLINAGVRNSVSERKQSRRLPHQQQVTIDNYWDNVCVWFEYVHTRRRAVIEVTDFLGLKRLKSKILIIVYRSFSITGNHGRRSFSKYGISYYTIHASIAKYGIDIQIVRPEMTKFKMFREFSKHEFFNEFILLSYYQFPELIFYHFPDACY
jgi:hypothetical protein